MVCSVRAPNKRIDKQSLYLAITVINLWFIFTTNQANLWNGFPLFRTAGKEATWIQGMVNRRLDFLFFLSAQLFRASLLSFLYRSLRSLSVDLKVSFTAPSGILYLQSLRTTVHSFSSFKSFTHSLSLLRDYVSQSFTYRSALTSLTLGYSLSFVTSLSIARPKGLALIYRS